MKRILLHIAIVLISFSAYAQESGMEKNEKKQNNRDMKTLVAYFSATGTTAKVAQQIAKICNGDLYEIKPSVKYSEADLNWRDKNSRSTTEMCDKASRPEIIKDLNNVEKYDTIFIGFPIWWYTAPRIINTFIETYDLSGKKIYLFATSGSSPVSGAHENLQNSYPTLEFKDAKLLNGTPAEEIAEWVRK